VREEVGGGVGGESVCGGDAGRERGGWFRKWSDTGGGLQGLKFGMAGLGGLALGRTGASVQNIPGGEMYQSLSSGAIDGAEWIGPFADERLGFQEVCDFYYTSGFHEPGSILTAAMNLDVWMEMTPAQQQIIKTAAEATHHWSLSQSNANNGAALARLQQQGTKLMSFPDDVWDAFGTAAKEALDEFMDDELFARIRESQETSKASTYGWTSISDGEFTRQRSRFNG